MNLLRKFKIKYGIEFGEFDRDPKKEKDLNIADSVVYMPIIREFPENPEKGRKFFGLFSADGCFKTPIPDFELLEAMLFLGKSLLGSTELADWHRNHVSNFVQNLEKEARDRDKLKDVPNEKESDKS